MADTQSLEKMKVAELKKLCKEKGLPTTGNKSDILARLQGAAISDSELGAAPEDDDDDVGDDLLNDDDDEIATKDTSQITTDADEAAILGDKDPEPQPAAKSPPAATVKAPEAKPPPVPKTTPAVVKPTSPTKPAPAPEPKTEAAASEEEPKKMVLKKIEFPENTEKKSTGSTGEIKILTEAERLARRANRFGVQSEDEKKSARSQRFGGDNSTTNGTAATKKSMSAASIKTNTPAMNTPEQIEKLKKRAERFGTVVSSSLTKIDEKERFNKRKERFGIPTTGGTTGASTSDEAKKRRLERFGKE